MKKILVIDDDSFFGKTLAATVPEGKYEIVQAMDGEEGLAKLKEEKPDMIILDVMMPKMDGMSFLKEVKESKDLPKCPILVSSNLDSNKKVSEFLALGAVGYVVKSEESMPSIIQNIDRILNE